MHKYNVTITGITGPGQQETTQRFYRVTELVIDGVRDTIWFKDEHSVVHDIDLSGGGGLNITVDGVQIV